MTQKPHALALEIAELKVINAGLGHVKQLADADAIAADLERVNDSLRSRLHAAEETILELKDIIKTIIGELCQRRHDERGDVREAV